MYRYLPVVICLLVAAGCGKIGPSKCDADGPMADGDMIIDSSIGDAKNLNPPLVSETAGGDIAGLVFGGLLRFKPDLTREGALAEKWKVSPDGRVITYHLRKGVKFHDGVEMTAEDVVFTWKCYVDPKVQTPYSSDYLDIVSVKALDRYTVRVSYKRAFAPALDNFGSILPKHLLEGKDLNKADFNRAPVGTGPFKFVEWKTDQKIVLEANPDYWEGAPHVKRFTMRIIPDQSTQFLELLNGGVDALGAWTRRGLTPEQYQTQSKTARFTKFYKKYDSDDLVYYYIGWNPRRPLFADRRVRRALTMAIDRQALVDNVLYGLGSVVTGPFYAGSWATNPGVKPLPFDPEAARKALAEAGWKDTDGDGLLDKVIAGKKTPFKFTLITNQGNKIREQVATIVQAQLKTIGIQADIRIFEWTTFLTEYVNKKNFDACVLGWSLSLDPDVFSIWHSSQTGEYQYNHVSYSNPEVDRLLVEGRYTLDQAKRQAIYRRIHRLIADDQPYTFLFAPYNLTAVHKRFKGITYHRFGGVGWDTQKWYVPKNQQKYQIQP